MSNKVDDLSESFLLSCFIFGLKPHIKHEVASFQPSSLTKAMALAKLQEQKMLLKNNPPKLFSLYPSLLPNPTSSNVHPSNYTSKPVNTSTSSIPFSQRNNCNTNLQTKPIIQKLSQSQIQANREKGLCFYYDEKYTMGYRCKASAHVLIVPDSEDFGLEDEVEIEVLRNPEEEIELYNTPHISLHAMSGIVMPQTLRFKGFIGKMNVQVLVDGARKHNFLQSRVVSLLNLRVSSRKQFDVMVGNGEILKFEGLCSAILVQIQKHVFLVDFYVLPIQGADVVLGVQWLQLLGPIMVDYQLGKQAYSSARGEALVPTGVNESITEITASRCYFFHVSHLYGLSYSTRRLSR